VEAWSPDWSWRLAIVLSILVIIHPGMTVVSIVYLGGIVLIIVGIERIISGIFVKNKSRWGTVGLGVLALIFGSIAVGYPVHTAVFVITFTLIVTKQYEEHLQNNERALTFVRGISNYNIPMTPEFHYSLTSS
jgi:uncharacterized membrane protein HdeD (DUF308 family)